MLVQSSKKVKFFVHRQQSAQQSNRDVRSKQQQYQPHGDTQHQPHGDTQDQGTHTQKGLHRQQFQQQVSQSSHRLAQEVHDTAQDVRDTGRDVHRSVLPEREEKKENKTLSRTPRHKYQQFRDSDDDVKHVRPVHPVQPLKELRTEPSPILRHKSLPSDLDIEKQERPAETSARSDEDLWLDREPPNQPRTPQSPRSVRRIPQSISHSQPQLLSSPPPSRRLILQQRQHQQTQHQQTHHSPSQPSTAHAASPQHNGPTHFILDLSNLGSFSDQHRNRSYPSTPLASPQTEMDILQSSLPHHTSPQKQDVNNQQRQQLLKMYALSPTGKQTPGQQRENFYLPPPPHPPITPGQKLDRKSEHGNHPTQQRHAPHRTSSHQPQKFVHFLSDVQPSSATPVQKPPQVYRPGLPAQASTHWPGHSLPVVQVQKQERSLTPRGTTQVPNNNNRLTSVNDKRPLCYDDSDDWQSEEGEESLV